MVTGIAQKRYLAIEKSIVQDNIDTGGAGLKLREMVENFCHLCPDAEIPLAIVLEQDDAVARALGWDSAAAMRAGVLRALGLLPRSLAERIEIHGW